MSTRVSVIDDAKMLVVLSHPTRVALLYLLREPKPRRLALPERSEKTRQRVNHHLRALEEAALVEAVETRQQRGFLETLYRSVAGTFLVSPRVAWGDPRRAAHFDRNTRSKRSIETGERLERDATALLDRAAFDGEDIASATVATDVRFADEPIVLRSCESTSSI